MGIYSRHIFPRLCDRAMRRPEMARLRSELLVDVVGEVLEIGFGTGLNLEHYPEHVRRLSAVDPGEGMGRIGRKRIARSTVEVDHRLAVAESLPFEDDRFDCVVSTWTLCSIPDVRRALSEVYRVLKPGGRFLFLEHGLNDDPCVRRWQHRLTPIQRVLADGCRLDLDVEAVVRGQPFREVEVERFLLEGTPRLLGSMYRGVARK
ncbi:class I SAM-dependent methyltransferase [Tautonia marina]|uniref:class I SAM-dependent methyltransferase n=1 Tax=Tautonia marina TaxID=2653855 RepID=UPI0012607D18|nr:class I SAM-dependent methyltransferase [Tautonia marina]